MLEVATRSDTVFEQLFHQRPENHGVGNVRHKELIETNPPRRLVGKTLGNDGQRVFFAIQGVFHAHAS